MAALGDAPFPSLTPRTGPEDVRDMSRRIAWAAAAVVLTLGAVTTVRAGDDTPAAPAGSRMRIHLDDHGKAVVPPPSAPSAPAAPPLRTRAAVRPVPEPAPGGGEMIRNGHVAYSVGHVGKDGRLTADCVQGGAAGR